jgi:hypothetical protein
LDDVVGHLDILVLQFSHLFFVFSTPIIIDFKDFSLPTTFWWAQRSKMTEILILAIFYCGFPLHELNWCFVSRRFSYLWISMNIRRPIVTSEISSWEGRISSNSLGKLGRRSGDEVHTQCCAISSLTIISWLVLNTFPLERLFLLLFL